MTLEQIDKLCKASLKPKEKIKLSQAILNNKKARDAALTGALASGNYKLAAQLITYKEDQDAKKTTRRGSRV